MAKEPASALDKEPSPNFSTGMLDKLYHMSLTVHQLMSVILISGSCSIIAFKAS